MEYEAEQISQTQWDKINHSLGLVMEKLKLVNNASLDSNKTIALIENSHKAIFGSMVFTGFILLGTLVGVFPDSINKVVAVTSMLGLVCETILGISLALADIHSERSFIYKVFKKPQWLLTHTLKLEEYQQVLNTESKILEDKYLQFQLLKFYQDKRVTVNQESLGLYQEFIDALVIHLENKQYNEAFVNIASLQLLVDTVPDSPQELNYYQRLERSFGTPKLNRNIKSLL